MENELDGLDGLPLIKAIVQLGRAASMKEARVDRLADEDRANFMAGYPVPLGDGTFLQREYDPSYLMAVRIKSLWLDQDTGQERIYWGCGYRWRDRVILDAKVHCACGGTARRARIVGDEMRSFCTTCGATLVGLRNKTYPVDVFVFDARADKPVDVKIVPKGEGMETSTVKAPLSRRRKVVPLSHDLLLTFLKHDGTQPFRVTGVPADAEIVGVTCEIDYNSEVVSLVLESAEFPEVEPGSPLPYLRPVVERLETRRGREFL